MKKVFTILIISLVLSLGIFAQEGINSYTLGTQIRPGVVFSIYKITGTGLNVDSVASNVIKYYQSSTGLKDTCITFNICDQNIKGKYKCTDFKTVRLVDFTI